MVIGWFGAEVAVYLAFISPLSALPFCPLFILVGVSLNEQTSQMMTCETKVTQPAKVQVAVEKQTVARNESLELELTGSCRCDSKVDFSGGDRRRSCTDALFCCVLGESSLSAEDLVGSFP